MRENFTRKGGARPGAHAISLGFLNKNGLASSLLKVFQETG
jgi:hypothetical protein